MKQHNIEWQTWLGKHKLETTGLSRQVVLTLGLGMLGLVLLSGLIYLPLSGPAAWIANAGAVTGVEQTLGTDYVLQTDFITGRYLLPLLISLLFTGAMLFWVLRHAKD